MKILDMTAGGRAIWLEKDLDFVTFLDVRAEMDPDIVCDTTAMPPEVGDNYDLVVYDPPHCSTGANGYMTKFYGHWTAQQIRDGIRGSAKEAHRVTRPEALMAFKWNDHDQKLDKILELMKPWWRPLFGHHMRNRGGSSAKSQTYWVMLLRAP